MGGVSQVSARRVGCPGGTADGGAKPATTAGSAAAACCRSGDVILAATDLIVRYGTGAIGVGPVEFDVRAGEMLAIVGPNGAGKTSILRGLGGDLPTEGVRATGSVRLCGQEMIGWPPHRRATAGLFSIRDGRKVFPNLTVRENLLAVQSGLRGAERAQRMEQALELFEVIAGRLDDPAGNLSGGQVQMLAIARGLMLDASVLLVDEMSLGIHASIRPSLFETVRAVAKEGRAAVIVDESLPLVLQHADRLIALEGGTFVAEGTPEEVSRSGVLGSVYSGELA